MNLPTLSARDRRALRLGVLVAMPALVWTLALGPYLDAVVRAGERLETEHTLLHEERALLAGAEEYPDAFREGAERLLAVAPRLFRRPGDGATAELAAYLGRHARESGVFVTRMEPRPAEPSGSSLLRLPLHAVGEADLEGVLTLLRSLRDGRKLVRISGLRIESPEARAGADGPATLSFEFTFTGFAFASPAADAEPETDANPRARTSSP